VSSFPWRAVALVVLGLVACEDNDPVPLSTATCPNELPISGAPCPEAGLVCNYFTGCEQFYPATCEGNLTWRVENTCSPPAASGAGGAGGGTPASSSSSSSTSSGSGGNGGEAGEGGFGGRF
jgi:hypothetical protein